MERASWLGVGWYRMVSHRCVYEFYVRRAKAMQDGQCMCGGDGYVSRLHAGHGGGGGGGAVSEKVGGKHLISWAQSGQRIGWCSLVFC